MYTRTFSIIRSRWLISFWIICLAIWVAFSSSASAAVADYVIQISVDGLGSPYVQALMAGNQLPNFKRLENEGVYTYNARTDYDYTRTLPDHTTMITGRGVLGDNGHNWIENDYTTPYAPATLHLNKDMHMGTTGAYIASTFDAAHDNGLRTSLYVGKDKFALYDISYDAFNGADDVTGADNGKAKIDVTVYNGNPDSVAYWFREDMGANPYNYSFLHFGNPDFMHKFGSTEYNDAIKAVDGYLGSLFEMVQNSSVMNGHTTIIVTADHGGRNYDHAGASGYLNYTIPFYVWGAGVNAGGMDLYSINQASRDDPGTGRPDYAAAGQPIRNGDGGNLAMQLLGLGPIPGSTINNLQNLVIQGTGTAPSKVFAYNAFNETTVIGITNWSPAAGETEIGFSTQIINNALTLSPFIGFYDHEIEFEELPRRFRMQGLEAATTFETVSLIGYEDLKVSIDIMLLNGVYETDDYYRAQLINGAEVIDLAYVYGGDLNSLPPNEFVHYEVLLPSGWTQATLIISSRTDAGDEGVDFDHIFFMGFVPEPATMAILMAGAMALLCRRQLRARGASCP